LTTRRTESTTATSYRLINEALAGKIDIRQVSGRSDRKLNIYNLFEFLDVTKEEELLDEKRTGPTHAQDINEEDHEVPRR
jgi:hypothetical protein